VAIYSGHNSQEAHLGLEQKVREDIAGIIIRLSIHITKEFINNFPGISFIGSPTTGVTHFQEEIVEGYKGINIYTLRNSMRKIKNITATSEHTLALMLALTRNLTRYTESVVEKNKWERELYVGNQLSTKTIGIIGFGRIGKQVAKVCAAMSMNILVSDIKRDIDFTEYAYVVNSSLDTLLTESDIISIHASYNHGDPPILNKDNLSKIKRGTLLINTARGELIDENALQASIKSGVLKGVALDVLEKESEWKESGITHPLARLARNGYNVLITPHIAGCTLESMQATELVLSKQIIATLKGGTDE